MIRPNFYGVRCFSSFDREKTSKFEIELRARDLGQPVLRRSMIIQLNVTDVNDKAPRFDGNFTFEIMENNRIPSVVGQIRAFDDDQGLNGEIFYSIVSSGDEFFISPIDGILSANRSFDFEAQRHFQIEVRARDRGRPALEASTLVFVKILNENEFAPVFEKNFYVFSIAENRTGNESRPICVGPVKAIDQDFSDEIFYEIENENEIFRIDQHGLICTDEIFDREKIDHFNLTLLAKDNSSSGSLGTSSVKILIRYSVVHERRD